MVRRFAVAILFVTFFTGLCAPFAALGARSTRKRILRDGLALTGIVGSSAMTEAESPQALLWGFCRHRRWKR